MNQNKPTYEELERRLRRAETALETLRSGRETTRYQSLFDGSRAVMLVIDPDSGEIVDANRAAENFYGWSRETLRNKNIAELNILSPEEIHSEMREAREQKRLHFLFKHRLADGSIRDVEVYSSPVMVNGEPMLHSIIHDVTAHREAEDKLRASEARFRAIFDDGPTITWIKDEAGRYVYLSRNFEKYFGIRAEDWIGKTCEDLYPPEIAANFRNNDRRALEEDHSMEFMEEADTPDGERRLCQVRKIPFRDAEGRRFVGGFGIDVTEHKQAEEALQDSESRHRIIFEKSPLGMIRFSPDGAILDCNEKFIQLMGSSREKLIGFNTAKQSAPEMRRTIRKALAGQTAVYEDEYTSVTGGKTTFLRVAFNPIHPGQNPTGVIATLEDVTDRKQMEEDLRKSEEKYRDIFNNSLWGIFQSTVDGKFLSCNEAFAQTFGYDSPEEVISTITDISRQYYANPEDRKKFIRLFQENGIVENFEFMALRKDGTKIWIANTSRAVRNKKGKTLFFEGAVRDISSRKKTQEKLKESEQKFSAAFMSSPAILVISTIEEGRYIDVNKAFTEITGYAREEALGKTSRELGAWVSEGMRSQMLDQFNRTGMLKNAELEVKTKAGGKKIGLLSTHKIRIEGKEYFLSQLFDITDQKAAEARLRESEARYRRLTDNAQDIIWRTDARGKFVFINPAVEKLLGFRPKSIIGFGLSRFMTKPSIDRLYETTDSMRAEKNGRDHFLMEVDYYDRDGGTNPFEINVVASRNEHGEIEGYEGISRDIADRKRMVRDLIQARQAAESADRAKSEFIANMSHELRTPLNAILGYCQILIRDKTLSERNRESIAVMKNSGEHLLILINDILEIAKFEAGKIELHTGPTDLKALVSQTVAMVRIKALQKKLDVMEEIDPALPRFVHIDEKRLRQVLLNLLSNAVKFTEKGVVTLRVRVSSEKIAFSVTDTGWGIPENKLANIFDAFQQWNPIDAKTEGTGLGLTISQNLARLMGGEITAKSAVGRGSVFRFEIPLQKAFEKPDAGPSAPSNTITGYEGNRRKVLIVDDFNWNRMVIRAMIDPLGFEIEEATDGLEAVSRFEAFEPDLILLDWVLPGIGGNEASRRIRAQRPTGGPVIIVITGNTGSETEKEIKESGVDDYIFKPVFEEELLGRIEKHLKLNWTYESAQPSAETGGAEAMPSAPPSKADLDALYALSRIGDLSGIREYVSKMLDSDPDKESFCRAVDRYAKDCEITKIRRLIENYTGVQR